MNTKYKSFLLLASVGVLFYSFPSAYAITFDEQTCMSLLSSDQVKSATGFEGNVIPRIIADNLAELNDDVSSGCLVGFENEDHSFSLALAASASTTIEATEQKYSQTLSQIESMDLSAESGNINGWEYYVVEIEQSGLGSALASMKGDVLIGFNAPATDHFIEASALLEMIKIVHTKVDDYSNVPVKDHSYLSPLKQIAKGISPHEVTCKDGMSLIFKVSDGNSACVKPSSVEKLIQRGWAIHVLPDYGKNENNNSAVFETGIFDVDTTVVQYLEGTNGFLAKPATDDEFPAIIMIHEWWGLNDNIKEMAQKLASHGYVVLAVDLYDGQIGTTPEEARQLISSFDRTEWISNMNSAAAYLDEKYSTTSLGSIGWCMGGAQSLQLALNNNDVDATVIYYGSLVTEPEDLSSIQWPVLGIFAELDRGIPPSQVLEFESALNDLGISNDIHIYPGVDHAFANPSGDRYAPEETTDAWQKTLEFFEVNLKQN